MIGERRVEHFDSKSFVMLEIIPFLQIIVGVALIYIVIHQ
jgi:hypothetical protein